MKWIRTDHAGSVTTLGSAPSARRRVALSLTLCLGLAVPVIAARAETPLQRYEAVEPHMGTLVRIVVYASDVEAAAEHIRAGFDRIRGLDDILSDYRVNSELNQVTRTAVGRPTTVSADLFAVLRASQDLAVATDGAFDVTQGPVIQLWRTARKTGHLPDPAALDEAARRSGYRKLRLDDARRTVTLDLAGMALDVGAIGKGYAASEALAVLTRRGVRSALVAVSGDLAFSNAPPGRRGWRIDVHPADVVVPGVPAILELTNAAVSTSGNSEQHLDIGGRRYSHVIDPAERAGLRDDITVTVIARHGLDADGLDTAISVIGARRGLALIGKRPDTAALIVERSADGTRAVASPTLLALAAAEASTILTPSHPR